MSRFALPLPPSPALVSLLITCISQAERVEGLSLRTGGQDGNVPLGRGSHKLFDPSWTECLYHTPLSLPNSYAEALTPYVMVFGSGDFGRWLGVDEV